MKAEVRIIWLSVFLIWYISEFFSQSLTVQIKPFVSVAHWNIILECSGLYCLIYHLCNLVSQSELKGNVV